MIRRFLFGKFSIPPILNEPMLNYAPGSREREALAKAITKIRTDKPTVVPVVIDGKEYKSGPVFEQPVPSEHATKIATVYHATPADLKRAIEVTKKGKKRWMSLPFHHRAAVFLKAADIAASESKRALICGATVLGQGKTAWQAEIDAAAELIDFWRFSAKFGEELYSSQPERHSPGVWNRMDYPPLEGFVAAIAPFNFTAIGGNLASAPALMGNTVIWKPSDTASLSNYLVYKTLLEAGLPEDVISFTPADGPMFSREVLTHPDLSGVHFTGSTATFNHIWKLVAANLENYKGFPRVVGETGGKNFHLIHKSADIESAALQTARSAFEYSGQKCSACSRVFMTREIWPKFQDHLLSALSKITVGKSDDFKSFTSAVIDERSFDKCNGYIKRARERETCTVISHGVPDKSVGYFIPPTIIVTTDPNYETIKEEIFGPILTVFLTEKWEDCLEMAQGSQYALTGAVFARDRDILREAEDLLVHSAGNLYLNDKSTGAVVGQQPFGGSRKSGTNDKSGSGLNLIKWVSARTIKETHLSIADHRYPHMN